MVAIPVGILSWIAMVAESSTRPMGSELENWRKWSCSGSGDGNNCVETANLHTRVVMRDSKVPAGGTLSFPAGTFTTFLSDLKTDAGREIEGP